MHFQLRKRSWLRIAFVWVKMFVHWMNIILAFICIPGKIYFHLCCLFLIPYTSISQKNNTIIFCITNFLHFSTWHLYWPKECPHQIWSKLNNYRMSVIVLKNCYVDILNICVIWNESGFGVLRPWLEKPPRWWDLPAIGSIFF